MDLARQALTGNEKKWLVASYLLYLAVLAVATMNHELWGDELHSWNIAGASAGYGDLIANSRYEGHPPVWYTILWLPARFGHQLFYLQCIQFCIAGAAVYVLMFRSAFPTILKILVPFGYYFLFEYGVLSRNYAIALLFAFM